MLTPILTVKTAAPSAHVTTPEAVLPKEKATAAPATLSGRQSEAALRILETINKQLLGSDMPPKDALVRLLDDWRLEPMPLSIAYRANRHPNRKLRAFIDYVREYLPDQIGA